MAQQYVKERIGQFHERIRYLQWSKDSNSWKNTLMYSRDCGPLRSQCAYRRQNCRPLDKEVPKVYSPSLQHGGSISCGIAGARHYSKDVQQGGIEVPCILIEKKKRGG